MDFTLTEKQQEIQNRFRQYARKEVQPGMSEFSRLNTPPAEVLRTLGELKLLAALAGAEYGGGGFDRVSYVAALIEIAQVWPGLGAVLLANNSFYYAPLGVYAGAEQQRQYVRPCAVNHQLAGWALQEAGSEADVAAIRTKALRTKQGWRISGCKTQVANACSASYLLVAAKEETREKTGSVRLWLVDRSQAEGLQVVESKQTLGLCVAGLADIVFTDTLIPDQALIEHAGQSGPQVMDALHQEARIGLAALNLGIGKAVLEETRQFAHSKNQGNRPLSNMQSVQWKLADMATDLDAAFLMTFRAAWLRDFNKPWAKEATMANRYAASVGLKAALDGFQLLAGFGYPLDGLLSGLLNDAKVCRIFENNDEMLASMIAQSLYQEF